MYGTLLENAFSFLADSECQQTHNAANGEQKKKNK